MNKLHERLLATSKLYADWHQASSHQLIHWAFFVLLALIFQNVILSSISDYVVEVEPSSQIAAAFSYGKVVGVSDETILAAFPETLAEKDRVELIRKYGLSKRGYIKELDVHILAVKKGESPRAMVEKMNTEGESVEFVEPNFVLEPSAVPNDPWYLNWQKNKVASNAELAWEVSTGVQSVVVAVVDTGISCGHEDLMANCVTGYNFVANTTDADDLNGHGTAVAGVIGAVGNNTIGVAGSAWAVSLMPLVVSDASGAASFGTIAQAITYAADRGVRVVNVSYQAGGSQTVQRAAKYLAQKRECSLFPRAIMRQMLECRRTRI